MPPQGSPRRIKLCLVLAGIPEPSTRRERWREDKDIAALLVSHGVAPDADAAARMAATQTIQDMSAHTVERNLEALSFFGWGTVGVSAQTVYRAGPQLVARTAYCRAHG